MVGPKVGSIIQSNAQKKTFQKQVQRFITAVIFFRLNIFTG
jgi:hypothetical protein